MVEDRTYIYSKQFQYHFWPLLFLFHLDKYIIDRHSKEIQDLKNAAFKASSTPKSVEAPKGNDFDMDQLAELFASKGPPDNTITRLEALEKNMAEALENGNKWYDQLRRI